jgi:ParB/RepB/Spo0J family partition protein
MTTMLLDPSQIVNNPYQTRLTEDAEHIAALAESIREVGLLQTPLARLRPHGEFAELAFGHSRLAAWKIAKPGEAFPLEIRALSDRQMSDLAAEENSRRKNLTAIETARAIQRRIDDFGLTQLEAGKPFGYQSQGAVSNLLRLLRLPEPVQASVAAGELPERLAREIIPLAKVLPQEAVKIAEQVARVDDGQRENTLDNLYNELLRRKAKWLHSVPWQEGWPAKPIKVEGHKSISEIPACKGCEFLVSRQYGSDACLRAECFEIKHDYAVRGNVKAASERLKIALRRAEKTELVYDGDTRQDGLAANALASKHASLRLVPHTKDDYGSYGRKRVLGSEWVELHTTDLAGLKKAIANLPKEKKQSAQDKYMDDYKREQKRNEARQKEVRRLLVAAAPHLAKAFAWPEVVLDHIIPSMAGRHFTLTTAQVEDRAKKSDTAGKAQIVAEIVLHNRTEGGAYSYSSVQPGEARKKIQATADALKVKLPVGWDAGIVPAPAPNGNGHKAPGAGTGKLSKRAKAKA